MLHSSNPLQRFHLDNFTLEMEFLPLLRWRTKVGHILHVQYLLNYKLSIVLASSGIYGVSGISMDIPVISIFQDPATHFTKSGDIL